MASRRPRKPRDFSRAIGRHKLIVLASVVVFTTAMILAAAKIPLVYQSNALLAVEPSAPSQGQHPESAEALVAQIRQRFAERQRIEQLIDRSALGDPQSEECVSRTRAAIVVDLDMGSSGDIGVSFRADHPEVAQRVASDLADSIISSEPQGTQNNNAVDVEALSSRTADLARRLRALEVSNPWLLSPNGAAGQPSGVTSRPQPESRSQELELESAKDQKYKLERQLADLDQRIAAQRQIVEQQKKNSSLRDSPTYAALVARRTELQGQRDTLMNRQELTDKHPRVAAISDQISAINREIEELRQQDSGTVRQSPEARELNALEAERNRLKLEIEVNARELARRTTSAQTPQRETHTARAVGPAHRTADDLRTAESYAALKQEHAKSVAKLRDLEAGKKSTDSTSAKFRLVQGAEIPTTPVSPDRRLLVALGIASGLIVGALMALFIEARRWKSIQDRSDVEFYTRQPLLAAIPKAASTDVQRSRGAAVFRMTIGAAATVLVIFVLAEALVLSNVLSMIVRR